MLESIHPTAFGRGKKDSGQRGNITAKGSGLWRQAALDSVNDSIIMNMFLRAGKSSFFTRKGYENAYMTGLF